MVEGDMSLYSYFLAGHNDGNVSLYKVEGGTFTKLANPDVIPSSTGSNLIYSADFSKSTEYMVIGCNLSPRIYIYKRSGDMLTKLPNPDVLPSGPANGGAKFSPNNDFLAVGHVGGSTLTIYSRSGDTFTKLADPASALGLGAVEWSRNSDYLATCYDGWQPYVYRRFGSVFSKLINASPALPTTPLGLAFSPVSDLLVVANKNAPRVSVATVSGDIITRQPDPASMPTASTQFASVAFNPDGSIVAIGADDGLFLYSVSGTALTRLTSPAGAPTSIKSVAFSADGSLLSVGTTVSPYVVNYSVSGSNFAQVSSPPSIYAGSVFGLAYSATLNSEPQPGDVVADKSISLANKNAFLAMQEVAAGITDILPSGLVVYYPNQPAWEQPSNSPWARIYVVNTSSNNVAVGAGSAWVRRNGIIVVDVFTPKGSGVNTNLEICERITDAFENTQLGNMKTFEANTAKIEDDPWLGYQVTINFYCEGF